MTVTTSVMGVVKLTFSSSRCERSPSPVNVGANTLWPSFSSRSLTRRQHHPPCHEPCTSTKVFGAACAFAEPPNAVAPKPATPAASVARRVNARPCPFAIAFLPVCVRCEKRSTLHSYAGAGTQRDNQQSPDEPQTDVNSCAFSCIGQNGLESR